MSDQLPAFLRRNVAGTLELVLHCTGIQTYYICPCKFWLTTGMQIEAAVPKVALNYGGAVHDALRFRYGNTDFSLTNCEAEQMELLQVWFEHTPQPTDEWRNAVRAQELVRAQNEWVRSGELKGNAGGGWSADHVNDEHSWQVLAVEEEFEVRVGEIALPAACGDTDAWESTMPDGKPCTFLTPRTEPHIVSCYLAGRKDLVVAWHGGVWVVDHKTASDWGSGETNSHLDEGRRSFQFRGYAWAERQRGQTRATAIPEPITALEHLRASLPVLGTVGNYLVSRKPYATDRKPAKPTPRNQFHQECYPYEASTLDEWQQQFLRTAAQILAQWQAGTLADDRHDTGCGHWGRCEFFDYCEEAPHRREGMLASAMFRPKVIEREV